MGTLLAFFISINVFFDFFDLFVLVYSEHIEGVEALALLTGRFSVFFAFNFIGLFAALFILMKKKGRETKKGLTIASLLTVFGIMNYRYYLIVVAQIVPLQPALPEHYYVPTFPEMAVFIGMVAIAMFIQAVLTKFLPMDPAVDKTASDIPMEATVDRTATDIT
jgi:Ni/Fe-hydrogenase subunit HybB-like protein